MSDIEKDERMELNAIYIAHDVPAFRKFLFRNAAKHENFKTLINETDEVLSDLLYQAKSHLPYLGPTWQEARNHLRMKHIWTKTPIVEYPKAVLDYLNEFSEGFPICNKCRWFREPHPERDNPCMYVGASPGDICCKGWQPLAVGKTAEIQV